jgi:hypothetical protein
MLLAGFENRDRIMPQHLEKVIRGNKDLNSFLLNVTQEQGAALINKTSKKRTKLVPRKRLKPFGYRPAKNKGKVPEELIDRICDIESRYKPFENNGYYNPWWSTDSSCSDDEEVQKEFAKYFSGEESEDEDVKARQKEKRVKRRQARRKEEMRIREDNKKDAPYNPRNDYLQNDDSTTSIQKEATEVMREHFPEYSHEKIERVTNSEPDEHSLSDSYVETDEDLSQIDDEVSEEESDESDEDSDYDDDSEDSHDDSTYCYDNRKYSFDYDNAEQVTDDGLREEYSDYEF